MARKKKTPAEQLQELAAYLQDRHERWEYIRKNGTHDPFWPDGVNINLVRNHCCYGRKQIKALCEAHGLPYPDIYHKPVPPEMPMDFMATGRVCRWQKRHTAPRKISHPVQLSLF